MPSSLARFFLCSVPVWYALCLAGLMSAQASAPRLESLRPADSNGWVRISSSFHSNTLLSLEASTNLGFWQNIGTLHDALWLYPDVASAGFDQRFYRLLARARTGNDDWKNQVLYPTESFRSTNLNGSQGVNWVKFAILVGDPARVYYQDSRRYLFHYNFATQRLPPFLGMDYAAFNAVSLYRTNQQVVLGTLLYPPTATYGEYGVQFVGLDPYTPEEISRWFQLVKATVYASNGAEPFYMPAFEQSEMARTNSGAFAALGIPVASVERWISLDTCYSTGWALGRLKFFPASEVVAAYSDGRLRPEDILLTDGVPADTPMVAGILTLSPSTPNSHTAILSQSFGIPFVYLPDPADQARVQALAGHKVVVRATVTYGIAEIKVLDVEGMLDPGFESGLLALKTPRPIQFLPKQSYGAIWASADTLVPTDIQYFGGKAANYGFLRRQIPTNCPIAIAFSFDLWDAFLEQVIPGGGMLRQEIAARLAPYTNYPPDIVSLKTNLAAIRDLFTQSANFTVSQQQAITNALTPFFNPRRNIRFRSSTNVEDAEHFTGAGLYDSYSGCLYDDMDGDMAGPCECDPTEERERGVFRAIRKVYASFYNDDAFLERLLHQVDESSVAMGVLVHHSFPDEEELANGVATPTFSFSQYSTNLAGDMVTQLGAESVSNPGGGSVPEVVSAARYIMNYGTSSSFTLKQYSSLVPLGAHVMGWQADYLGFMDLFAKVGVGFRQFYPAKNGFTLDFEYKKDANLGLVVKQVRELPKPATTNSQTTWLIDEPATWSVLQAEGGSVFAKHRLKSIWDLRTANLYMAPANLVQGIYTQGSLQFIENSVLQTLSGPLNGWPNASNSPSGSTNYWTTGSAANLRSWRLETALRTNVLGSEPPIMTQADFQKTVTVTYATPMPVISFNGVSGNVTNETVTLELRPQVDPGSILQQRTLVRPNVVTIETSFYWPKEPGGMLIYTAPLVQFVETRITGLTTEPIVLTNAYSQTYGPGHHNFTEEFIFEPRLDPGLSAASLAQLNAANIQLIYAYWTGGGNPVIYILGLDRKFRPL